MRVACWRLPQASSLPLRWLARVQELLEHPFLRPTAAPAPPAAAAKPAGALVELSREQLTKLLQQVATAGVSGTEVGQLSDQLFKQLSSGLSPDLVSHKAAAAAEARQAAAAAAASAPAPAPAPARPPQQPQRAHAAGQQPAGSVAAAAAQAASSRAGQQADAVAALEARRKAAAAGVAGSAAAGAGSRAALMPISQSALAQQAAALRRVEPAQKQPAAAAPVSGLEAALRKGVAARVERATQGRQSCLPFLSPSKPVQQLCGGVFRSFLSKPASRCNDQLVLLAALQAWSDSSLRTPPPGRTMAAPLEGSAACDHALLQAAACRPACPRQPQAQARRGSTATGYRAGMQASARPHMYVRFACKILFLMLWVGQGAGHSKCILKCSTGGPGPAAEQATD